MLENKDYYKALYGDRVIQAELEQILLSHFSRSKGVSPRQIEYFYTEESTSALTLIYNSDGKLLKIQEGPTLKEGDIEKIATKIEELLLAPGEFSVRRRILFSDVPLKSFFRYKNIFQLSPLPSEAPRPPYIVGDHPLYLEFSFLGSKDYSICSQRSSQVGDEIELLCVAIIQFLKGSLGNTARMHWVIPPNSDPTTIKSQFSQEVYTWPQFSNPSTDKFLSTEDAEQITKVDGGEYYSQRGISVNSELSLPNNVEDLIGAFFKLGNEDKECFLRASYWFRHAQRTSSYSTSAVFISLVSAVEALMGQPPSATVCEHCKNNIGPGPTRRFVEFVERYAPGPATSQGSRKRLYTLRSKLSHGGHLLHTDQQGWGWGMSPAYLKQWENMDEMWQIVRVSFANWLFERR